MKKTVFYALIFLLYAYSALAQGNLLMQNYEDYKVTHVDLKEYFKEMDGCAVFLNPVNQQFTVYNASLAEQRFSPFSTFKIVSALLGLDLGVVQDANSKMRYSGTQYWYEPWNKDLTFKEAFQFSGVWYFRQLIDKIPVATMQKALENIRYGNADVSAWQGNGSNALPELNGFWLNSSLRISPWEQTKAMYALFSMGSSFSALDRDLVASFMQVGHGAVHGKTGSDGRGQSWFVGFIRKGLYKEYFAFYVKNAKDAKPYAKNIALEVLKNN